MTKFVRGIPQTTDVPSVTVDAGLNPGLHRFSLVVVDDADHASAPDETVIEVRELTLTPLISVPAGVTSPAKTRTRRSKR